MAKSKRGWVALALIGVGAFGTYRLFSSDDDASDHVVNQLWIGKLPQSDRDMFDHVVLLDQDGGRFGVWGKSSTWRHDIEIFKFGREKERLSVFFPQTRKTAKGSVRAWTCDAPKPFELCLEIVLEGKKRLYYSREDWVIEPGNVGESLTDIAEGTPELQGLREQVAAPIPDDE